MKEQNQNNPVPNSPKNLDEFITSISCTQQENIKVFLSRCYRNTDGLPQDFLMVDNTCFRKVGVTDVNYCNNMVTIDIRDCQSKEVRTLCFDINGSPEFRMVNWQDVQEMVREDKSSCGESDLLEFCF